MVATGMHGSLEDEPRGHSQFPPAGRHCRSSIHQHVLYIKAIVLTLVRESSFKCFVPIVVSAIELAFLASCDACGLVVSLYVILTLMIRLYTVWNTTT